MDEPAAPALAAAAKKKRQPSRIARYWACASPLGGFAEDPAHDDYAICNFVDRLHAR